VRDGQIKIGWIGPVGNFHGRYGREDTRWRLFPNFLPWNRGCTLAFTFQQTKPFLGSRCDGFGDHESVEGIGARAGHVCKVVMPESTLIVVAVAPVSNPVG